MSTSIEFVLCWPNITGHEVCPQVTYSQRLTIGENRLLFVGGDTLQIASWLEGEPVSIAASQYWVPHLACTYAGLVHITTVSVSSFVLLCLEDPVPL